MKSEVGSPLIETVVALALLGIVGLAFLTGLATSSRATVITNERATAESLVRSQVEYVKNYDYQYDVTEYPVDPALLIPASWTVPPPLVELVHATDDGLQEVTVSAEHNGETVLSVTIYKVYR